MMRIAVVTTTRAEYGLLSPVIKELRKKETDILRVDLVVTGTHLSTQYGMTIEEIISSEDRIDYKIPIPVNSDNECDISYNQAETLIKFTNFLKKKEYNAVILLGDRYETLAIAIAAGNTRTPIFHLCGGDTTEGALDEWIRHSITKMSYLHFVTNEVSKKRVIQMGESPDRVFNYGSTSIDNTQGIANMTREEALMSIGLSDCRYALCTYHPVTMEGGIVEDQIIAILKAISKFPEMEFIITKSNSDQGGGRINEILDQNEGMSPNLHVFASLGARRYLSLMKYSQLVLGNSSSGIIEAPAFRVPTVNIGERQRGRLQASSIVNCDPDIDSIVSAIKIALSKEHLETCNNSVSLYGTGDSAKKIANKVVETVISGEINLMKEFYDIGGNIK